MIEVPTWIVDDVSLAETTPLGDVIRRKSKCSESPFLDVNVMHIYIYI